MRGRGTLPRVTLTDLLGLLIGRRQSILNIAQSHSALWVGVLLVFSAAMAREYDRHWLLAEWWHLLLPFGASILLSLLQFSLFWMRRDPLESTATFAGAYRSFLTCFWMTAPLAWLYAIPYERFLGEADAVLANVWTLAIVSVLRGLIICRVLQVTARVTYWRAFMISLLPAQLLISGTIFVTPLRILDVMSGIRQTPAQHVMFGVMALVLAETVYVAWVVVILGIGFLSTTRTTFTPSPPNNRAVRGTVWLMPVIVSLAFVACLPWTQPPWQRAYAVDEFMWHGKVDEAIRLMASHPRSAFPPDWYPLPDSTMIHDNPSLLDVLDHISAVPPDAWPRQYYLAELERVHLEPSHAYYTDEIFLRVEKLLDTLPEGVALKLKYAERLEMIRDVYLQSSTTRATPQP